VVNKSRPVQVGTGTNWRVVAAGYDHTVAVKTDGTLWASGDNGYGQLGDGTTADKLSPVQVGTDTNWQVVAAGESHTVAVKAGGTLWAWGWNNSGQLGDGTTASKSSPVQVGTDTMWRVVAAGAYHTVSVKTDGTLWAWGDNYYGQLGDGTAWQETPIQIGAPVIQVQPMSLTMVAGSTATFSVTASGAAPLQYQWRFNGAALSGATSNSYSILAASTNQVGSYWVVVTNASGSVTSDVVSLSLLVPPSIVTQPRSQVIPPGSNVTFTVLAAGAAPLSYQWQAHGTNLGGATGTALSLLSVSTSDAGGYVVVVTNWAGSVTSAVATLQVREWLRFQTEGGVMGMVTGSFRLRLVGMAQASAVVIEASTNLRNWTPLYTNPGPSTLFEYSDPVTTNRPNRFYRAVEVP